MTRLLWLASDEVAPAKPWVATVAEADALWWAAFGDRVERARQVRRDAIAVGARGGFVI